MKSGKHLYYYHPLTSPTVQCAIDGNCNVLYSFGLYVVCAHVLWMYDTSVYKLHVCDAHVGCMKNTCMYKLHVCEKKFLTFNENVIFSPRLNRRVFRQLRKIYGVIEYDNTLWKHFLVEMFYIKWNVLYLCTTVKETYCTFVSWLALLGGFRNVFCTTVLR